MHEKVSFARRLMQPLRNYLVTFKVMPTLNLIIAERLELLNPSRKIRMTNQYEKLWVNCSCGAS